MDAVRRSHRGSDPRHGGVLMAEVRMPRLSDSMEEGTIVRWLKADGDEVRRGEEIVEIETDKATMSYEADAAGQLVITAPEGEALPVGALIATIAAARRADGGVSPVARRLAAALGVAITDVQGSGRRGRVLKADVRAAAASNGAAAGATPAPAAAPRAPENAGTVAASGPKGEVAVAEPSQLQRTVARRMSESKATVPDFAIEVDVDMTDAVALRGRMKAELALTPSLNDLVIKAAARALREHPRVNGSFRDGRFETYERVNVGVAVATDDGLVVPTVFDADRRSLGDIAAELRRLAGRVRDGQIAPPELAGGTFTVSNLGMFGVDRFAGVINPPQAAILCVGAVVARPAVTPEGSIAVRQIMTLTLVSDHRILYGASAARFLADVRSALEAPLALLL
jgi:pyruvate dehydrogenase E2 component (dihydrolipoamide acetyltransferase)